LTHPARGEINAHASHFGTVGTERYDSWRVAWDAFLAHPLGGLGQDNFADYYDVHGRTGISVQWTHSLEMRLLGHTGLVGTLAFVVFLIGALIAAIRARRSRDRLAKAVAGIALMPLIVWFVHGSIDWFWEIPALTGPALMFLAGAGALLGAPRAEEVPRPVRRWTWRACGALAVVAAAIVLVFPYLSVREMSIGTDLRASDPNGALAAFHRAGDWNPLNADPGRFGGTYALQLGRWREARRFYAQAIDREPDGWLPWFGSGLAASELGHRRTARHDFRVALAHENSQPAIREALQRLDSRHPLTAPAALKMLIYIS
jgi:tetratricopeptide (TPR) repeat protein